MDSHMPLVTLMVLPAATSLQNFLWHVGNVDNSWHIDLFLTDSPSVKTPNYFWCMTKLMTPVSWNFLNQTKKEMAFSAFSLWNILEAKLSKLQIRTTVYNPRPHPVKLNTLPKCKARLRPQTGRPGPGLSPPTHCQLGCFSKTRKQVTLASHFPHTEYTQTHTPNDPTISPIHLCHLSLTLSHLWSLPPFPILISASHSSLFFFLTIVFSPKEFCSRKGIYSALTFDFIWM